ncbi:NUDIX domain-containing protein [Patescibacteria group bacterium]|nr:MAG: NUDIX domain-containing protein [Patescibacteria group bacterium]
MRKKPLDVLHTKTVPKKPMSKIPERAKLVFQGIRYDVFQWEQDLYDGTTKTFEMIRRASTVEALVVVGDRIIIQQEEQPHVPYPFLSFPGGCIEPGETPQEAVVREVLEETGYSRGTLQLLHVQNPLQSQDWSMYVFIFRGAERMREPQTDAGEKITIRLVTFDELIDLVDRGEFYRFESTLRLRFIRAKYHRPSYEILYREIFKLNRTGKHPSAD